MTYENERVKEQSNKEWLEEYDGGMKNHNQGVANAYVLAGYSKEDRAKRLAELPEDMRKKAESHVRTVFAVRNHHKRNS
jgi:hypothetical protein